MTAKVLVLSFVDGEKAVADGEEIGTQRWILVPAITHQLNQLNIVGRVVGWNWRTKWRCLAPAHTNEYICFSKYQAQQKSCQSVNS